MSESSEDDLDAIRLQLCNGVAWRVLVDAEGYSLAERLAAAPAHGFLAVTLAESRQLFPPYRSPTTPRCSDESDFRPAFSGRCPHLVLQVFAPGARLQCRTDSPLYEPPRVFVARSASPPRSQ